MVVAVRPMRRPSSSLVRQRWENSLSLTLYILEVYSLGEFSLIYATFDMKDAHYRKIHLTTCVSAQNSSGVPGFKQHPPGLLALMAKSNFGADETGRINSYQLSKKTKMTKHDQTRNQNLAAAGPVLKKVFDMCFFFIFCCSVRRADSTMYAR